MAADNVAQQTLDAQNLKRAVDLRARGAHWNEIAEACKFSSPAAALKAVGEAMAAATMRAEETADQRLDTANLRLEHLLRQTLNMLDEDAPETYDQDGNPQIGDDRAVKLRAVDEARRLVESMAKLNKLDKQTGEAEDTLKIQIVGIDPKSIV